MLATVDLLQDMVARPLMQGQLRLMLEAVKTPHQIWVPELVPEMVREAALTRMSGTDR